MQNAKEILSNALAFHAAIESARADGKLELADVAHFAAPLLKLPASIDGASEAVAEFKAASDEVRAQVLTELKAEYDIADDVLEAKVESALEWLMASAKFLGALKAA